MSNATVGIAIEAVLLHEGSTLAVVINALRLLIWLRFSEHGFDPRRFSVQERSPNNVLQMGRFKNDE